jgi:hypothetical protein
LTPASGSSINRLCSEGFPSGQREQTVNLSSNDFGGSNPPPSTTCRSPASRRVFFGLAQGGAVRKERLAPALRFFLRNPCGCLTELTEHANIPEVIMRTLSLFPLLFVLFLCGWSAQLFAATGHVAHGVDPNAYHLLLSAEPQRPRPGSRSPSP